MRSRVTTPSSRRPDRAIQSRWIGPLVPLVDPRRRTIALRARVRLGPADGVTEAIDSGVRAMRDQALGAERPGPGRIFAIPQLAPAAMGILVERLLALHRSTPPFRVEVPLACFLAEPAATIRALNRLASRRVGIWLGEFGRGGAPLDVLHRLPVSGVTLSGRIVARLGLDAASHAVLDGLVAGARRLDVSVTALGVSDETQLRWVVSAGCDAATGPLFHPDAPDGHDRPLSDVQVSD